MRQARVGSLKAILYFSVNRTITFKFELPLNLKNLDLSVQYKSGRGDGKFAFVPGDYLFITKSFLTHFLSFKPFLVFLAFFPDLMHLGSESWNFPAAPLSHGSRMSRNFQFREKVLAVVPGPSPCPG